MAQPEKTDVPVPSDVDPGMAPMLKLSPVWTCGRCGTALRPPPGQLVAAMQTHAEVCAASSCPNIEGGGQ